MNEYERLISNAPPERANLYDYGGKAVTAQTLFFCITVAETCKNFGVENYSGVAARALILIGQPWIPTRAKPLGATEGTSIASLVLRTLIDINFEKAILPTLTNKSMLKFRFSMTRNLGAFIGRWIPQIGATLAAYDVVKIATLSILHYKQLVRDEDRINDTTTGSFG